MELQHRVEQFLYAEAELLDNHLYDEWIALFPEDALYWIPSRQTRPIRERDLEVSRLDETGFADDTIGMLRGRVRRITSGIQWSEEPPSRTRRLLTNIRVDEQPDATVLARTNFFVYRSRLERHQDWFVGERFDTLRPVTGGGFPYCIAERKIVFDQTTVLAPSISIFL
ncbi:aromatic-ring-hydroxylating dioxygenase subunit beta [Amycolatopsis rhabdoformis]|uniref:Aromatic-ring-hydroxylating dioxygenase subunit beta n=1 Tax=Amycolatopsis rhabdoformis TaxID=1448059 RepID=A0ABZ1IJY1_9PSEU|nr:aromatic-ring-hydroxylating dioxygenase subunit beta [Amycolatopsis rhabdoformis]WSE34582.1 aromatic-ring-hydroxylating dioxygenase subunit beta [Amycolatopsis rhabdoformis]